MARPYGRQVKQPKATTSSDDAGTLIPARTMRPISSTSSAAQRVTSIASLRARSRPTYRCRRHKVGDGDQSARSRSPAVAAHPRRRGDRVNHCGSCMSFAAVHESGIGTKRTCRSGRSMSVLGGKRKTYARDELFRFCPRADLEARDWLDLGQDHSGLAS